MSLSALKREHSLSIRRPNPMWIFTPEEKKVLVELLFPLMASDGRPFLYETVNCWDDKIRISLSHIRGLSGLESENPKRAILSLHRETTVQGSGFVDIDGHLQTMNLESAPFRQYFDGFSFNSSELGHAGCACVDFDAKKIWTQDPQGIPVKSAVSQTFKTIFPDFEYQDLQIKQQNDAHSCAFISLYNMECFVRGEVPLGHVDVMALRSRYAGILDNYDRAENIKQIAARYYEAPIHTLRYTPV